MPRNKLEALWMDKGDIKWSLGPDSDIAYLGWCRRSNLGDESMWLAAQTALPETARLAPLHSFGRMLARRGSCRTLVIGGGTLLGRPEWLARAEEARRTLRAERVVVLGTGVEPVDFGTSRGTTSAEAMRKTARFLRDCEFVGVRGPRSQQELEDFGVSSAVVGDPALSLGLRTPKTHYGKRVGVNLASVNDGWATNRSELLKAIQHVVNAMRADSIEVEFFPMEPDDVSTIASIEDSFDRVHPWQSPVTALIRRIDSFDLIISERLHGGILGAARGVPFIQIGYKPKVYDFAESISAVNQVIDPREVSGTSLTSAAFENLLKGPSSAVKSRVSTLSHNYREAARSVSDRSGFGW